MQAGHDFCRKYYPLRGEFRDQARALAAVCSVDANKAKVDRVVTILTDDANKYVIKTVYTLLAKAVHVLNRVWIRAHKPACMSAVDTATARRITDRLMYDPCAVSEDVSRTRGHIIE